MATDSGGRPLTLPGINSSSNLSSKNLHNSSASNVLRPRDRTTSFDSSTGDSDQSVSAYGAKLHGSGVALSSRQLQHLFPYHISVDREFNVLQLGEKLYPLVRATLSPNSSKKRLNQHISKYFRIVSPSTHVNCWDAKVLANLHLYSPSSSGLVDLELVGRDSMVSSTSQRYNDDALQAAAAKLCLRGRFHELTGFFPPPASTVIYEQERESEGLEGSDGSDKREESAYIYIFLMYPVNQGAFGDSAHEAWSTSSFATISAAAVPGFSRSVSDGTGNDMVAKLLAENAALAAENERLKGESKAQDLRGMIGNVAHDLKTPLAAFMGGVDLINDMAQECSTVLAVEYQQLLQQQAEQERISPRSSGVLDQRMRLVGSLRTILKNITQQASGVRDINQFMTMTINRCIDYTKASQGVKLVPRNETINLTEVLAMPINCMIASQTKVAFRLLPPPEDMCSHVITDKIWLQENVLCLLSNAAKYSNAGRVDIQISLFPAQSLANAAVTAAAMLSTSTSSGSHKNELRAPTENIVGPLSAKQVYTIHNQRCERAAAAYAAASAAGASEKPSASGRPRQLSRTSQNAASRRSSASSVVSNSSNKVLSPVVPPHRQTISIMEDNRAQAEGVSGTKAGLGITIPSNTFTGTGASADVPIPRREESAKVSPLPRSPRASTSISGKMESKPRANTTTDPLSQPSSSFEDAPISSYLTSTSSSNPNTPKNSQLSPISHPGQLSPINHSHAMIHPSAIAHGAVSPTQQNIAAATAQAAAGSYPPPTKQGMLGALGFGKGRLPTASVSPSHSQSVSRRQSKTSSQSQSRANSADIDPATGLPSSSTLSSPIGFLRSKMGKADKLRTNVHHSFDSNDETHSLVTSTVHEDIEAMALRGSFSDGEGDDDVEERPSFYSDATSSRQVSTDSRQFSSESRGYRFSADLSMGNLDEDEEESAKTILSQHHLLYPPPSVGTSSGLAHSPSSYSFLSSSNYVPNTPVEVFPQTGGGLFMNRPIQKLQQSERSRSQNATPPNVGDHQHQHSGAQFVPPPNAQVTPLLLIEISDTGIGLTESNMNKLFNPFTQAQRLAGGTGLGLYSLSKRLDALGGHYGVESRKDGQPGSLFWFAIPYREDVDAATNFGKLQRSGSSRLEDLILSAQPTLAQLMAAGEISDTKKSEGIAAMDTESTKVGVEEGEAEDPNKTSSVKSVADPEPQAESAPHSLHCSSQSSSSLVSSRTSQGSIPPYSPTGRARHASFGAAQNDTPPHASAPPPAMEAGTVPMHFLLVDDSESILKVTSMLLVRSGHTVERAENGVIALDKLAESMQPGARRFDVVVMDLQMPVLDGLEATKRLREIEEERFLAAEAAAEMEVSEGKHGEELAQQRQIVIGLSANGDEDTMQAAYAAGVDRFIEKPFTIQKLLDALSDMGTE